MQEEGWTVKAAGELRTLATAIESYYIHNGRACPYQTLGVTTGWQSSLPGNGPTIVASTLYDPFIAGETQYSYATSASTSDGDSQYYIIFSVGPDGSASITGVDPNGDLKGTAGDDIYFTNAEAGTGGF